MSHAKFRADLLKTVAAYKEERTSDRQTHRQTDRFDFVYLRQGNIT